MTKRIKRFKKYVKKIKKDIKISTISIIFKFIRAKICGMTIKKYVKYKFYKFNKKQMKLVKNIKKETKWTYDKIGEEVYKARRNRVSLYRFYTYKYWMLTEKEQKELSETIKKRNEKQKLNKIWFANVIVEKCGCSYDEAIEKLEIGLSKKYSYRNFIASGKYALSLEELEKIPMYKQPKYRTSNIKDELIKEKEMSITKIKEDMHWNDAELKLNYFKANVNCGCNFHEYYIFDLYKMSAKKQKEYITSELWGKLFLRYCDYADTWKYFKEKKLFNEEFHDYIKRDWVLTEKLSFKDFKKFINDKDSFIFKPLNSACGLGIIKYKVNKSSFGKYMLYLKLKISEKGIIEGIIQQHETMKKLNPSTVNTIRVQTITLNNKVNFLNATIRMGSGKNSVTDNFSSGGVLLDVDVKTGISKGVGSSKLGGALKEHPESKVSFKNFKVPNWDKVLKEVEKAAKRIKTMPYIGWDVVINKDGSIQLIEGNHDGDATLHQYCSAIGKHKGIRNTIDKYIWFDEKEKTV